MTLNFSAFLPAKGAKIAVGISGGVDSSLTAYLLKEAGYDVFGIFMKNWEESFSAGYCTAEEDWQDAQEVCDHLHIPLHPVNFVEEYHRRVFSFFLQEYEAGRTPNPDVLCNREIKFAELLHYAQALGADFLATGHYAQRRQGKTQAALYQAKDQNKDQTYFLHQITQEQLSYALFPLGEMEKTDVRALAKKVGLNTFDKKDSTGICFIGERPFHEFLANYFPPQEGEMRTPEGEVVGKHQGLMFYTIGQRQGLGIGGRKNAINAPWYVLDKDEANNVLIVGQGEHEGLYHQVVLASQCSWLNETPRVGQKFHARIRHRQALQSCTLKDLDEAGNATIVFDEMQRAVTAGQYVALYDGQRCLGGGVIVARRKIDE